MRINTILLIIIIVTVSCTSNKNPEEITNKISESKNITTRLKHATNFKIFHDGSHKIVEIVAPFPGAIESLRYRLIPKSEKTSNQAQNYSETIIYIPVETFVCTSTTHLAPLDMLNVEERLIGFPSTEYISSSSIRDQVISGKTIELGKDNDLNIELLMELSPELVMSYTMTGNYNLLDPIKKIGIPVIMNAEYLEKTPLGRAEWIKYMALFFNKEKQADSIYNIIEGNYIMTQSLISNVADLPTVMSGVVYGDTWYVPGGQSWSSKFFKDAGANYAWKNDISTGSLQLSFESVYEKVQYSDFWIGAANYFSLNELKKADYRYANFNAFVEGNVYSYNARTVDSGGNDYFESGFSRPDIVLNDLVKILHPNLLPDHKLYYFRQLDKTYIDKKE